MTTTTSSTDQHAALIDAGWSCRIDGRWRAPDYVRDDRAFSLAAAWSVHVEQGITKADRP